MVAGGFRFYGEDRSSSIQLTPNVEGLSPFLTCAPSLTLAVVSQLVALSYTSLILVVLRAQPVQSLGVPPVQTFHPAESLPAG